MSEDKSIKLIMPHFEKPEHELLARVVAQALDDVDTLSRAPNEKAFIERRNDLWCFFSSPWLHEIADALEMDMNHSFWEDIRCRIWKCTKRTTNVQKRTSKNKSV